MLKNHNALLLVAVFWMVCTVLNSNILTRAVSMLLAVSILSDYISRKFPTTSKQRIWLGRSRNFSMAAAAVFLILETYYLFIA